MEEDGGWVREGRGSHEIGQRRQVRAAGGSGGRLGGMDVGDWRQLAVGGMSIESSVLCIIEEETPRWKKNIMRLELGMFGLRSDAAFNA